jgi:hypothetical protein
VKSLPPLHEVAEMAGVELPEYLGRLVDTRVEAERPASGDQHGPATKAGS